VSGDSCDPVARDARSSLRRSFDEELAYRVLRSTHPFKVSLPDYFTDVSRIQQHTIENTKTYAKHSNCN